MLHRSSWSRSPRTDVAGSSARRQRPVPAAAAGESNRRRDSVRRGQPFIRHDKLTRVTHHAERHALSHPPHRRPAAAPAARRRRRARADQLAPAAVGRRHLQVPDRRRGNRPRPAGRAAARSRRRTRSWTLSRTNVFDERASAVYLPPGVHADRHGRDAARGDPRSRRRRRPAASAAVMRPGRRRGQRARQGQLRARSAQRLRHRLAREAADGRRDVQPARATGAAIRRTSTTAATASRCSKRSTTTASRRRRASASS